MLPFGSPTRIGSRRGPPTFYNPSDKDSAIGLTESNCRATKTVPTGTAYSSVRALVARRAGRFHIEHDLLAIGSTGSADVAIGLASLAAAIVGSGGTVGVAAGSVGIFSGSGRIFVNGSNVGGGSNLIFPSTGARLIQEWDLVAALLWFQIIIGGAPSNWNDDVLANPATGANGIDISSVAGAALAPTVSMETAGDDVRTNFGATAFTRTPTSGFGSYG